MKIPAIASAFATALVTVSAMRTPAIAQTAYDAPNATKSKILIRVDHDVVKSGSKIVIEIRETFVSDGVDGAIVGQESPYGLDVRLANGKTAPLTERGRKWNRPINGSGFSFDVEAGTTWNNNLVISDLYDMSRPGKYSVQVSCSGAKSNTITLTVVPQP